MRRRSLFALFILSVLGVAVAVNAQQLQSQASSSPPALDKQKTEQYLRYAEGYPPEVHIEVDNPKQSPFNGLYQVMVHLSAGRRRMDQMYYLTPDGKRLISGNIYDLNSNPFRGSLSRLVTAGPVFGPANAPVTIVVFSDFQCPFCQTEATVLRENLPKAYPKDVRVVFKNFPLESIHPWAKQAAQLGHCIAQEKESAFWLFHDWIYQHQKEISPENLDPKVSEWAKQQGLNSATLKTCVTAPATLEAVEKTKHEAQELEVTQTPTLFVNGRKVQGALEWEALNTVIKLELNRPKQFAGLERHK